MILRPERFELYQDSRMPLTVTTPEGDRSTHQLHISSPNHIRDQIHRLLICTKAGDALQAVQSVEHCLAPSCHILLLQNGMGSQQAIARALPDTRVWAASSTDGAWLEKPFNVHHAGWGVTWTGLLTEPERSSADSPELSLEHFPLKIQVTDQIQQKLWEKLAINCAINGMTALHNCRNGELIDHGERQQQLDGLIDEIITVMEASNIPSSNLHNTIHSICEKTARNFSSTCVDRNRQRKTELAYINGYLIETVKSRSVAVPRHQALMSELAGLGVRW